MSDEQFLVTQFYRLQPDIVLNALLAFILTLVTMPLIKDRLQNYKCKMTHFLSVVLFCVLAMIASLTFAQACVDSSPILPVPGSAKSSGGSAFSCAGRTVTDPDSFEWVVSEKTGTGWTAGPGYIFVGGWSDNNVLHNCIAEPKPRCPAGKSYDPSSKMCKCALDVCKEGDVTKEGFYDFGEMTGV